VLTVFEDSGGDVVTEPAEKRAVHKLLENSEMERNCSVDVKINAFLRR